MEEFLSWDVDWYYVAVTVVAIIGWILDKTRYRKSLDDAVYVSRTAYSAIEEGNNIDAKKRIKEVVEKVAEVRPGVKEINDVLITVVDEKKAAVAHPLTRFWRRTLSGENMVGVVGRIALKAAIQELLNKKKEDHEE